MEDKAAIKGEKPVVKKAPLNKIRMTLTSRDHKVLEAGFVSIEFAKLSYFYDICSLHRTSQQSSC